MTRSGHAGCAITRRVLAPAVERGVGDLADILTFKERDVREMLKNRFLWGFICGMALGVLVGTLLGQGIQPSAFEKCFAEAQKIYPERAARARCVEKVNWR